MSAKFILGIAVGAVATVTVGFVAFMFWVRDFWSRF